jgi:DNA (cytosine-5)-methyltransferase 1
MDCDLYINNGAGVKNRAVDVPQRAKRVRTSSVPRSLGPLGAVLKVLTLCSGIEAIIQGLENLHVPHVHVGSCDNNAKVRAMIARNFSPLQLFGDLTAVDIDAWPDHDLLVAGFPCQPWSSQGSCQGCLDAAGRGLIILYIVRIINAKMPSIVVLENVKNLISVKFAEFFHAMLGLLAEVNKDGHHYRISWAVMDTKFFGLPHSRPRVYIVLLRSDCAVCEFQWPKPRNALVGTSMHCLTAAGRQMMHRACRVHRLA